MSAQRVIIITLLVIGLSSCQLTRFVVYNFADITDHKIFPERELYKATEPFEFPVAVPNSPPKTLVVDGVETPFGKFLEDRGTVAFLIIRHDTILYEAYFNDYEEESVIASFSMAKSITSLLIGCAIEDGYIQSENEAVIKYVPEMKNDGFEHVTIKNLLQMTSGIKFNESYINPFGDAADFYYGNGLREKTMALKLEGAPGEVFNYTSGTTQLLGLVLERAMPEGETITSYLQKKLWSPLEMEYNASWSVDQKSDGLEKTFCCLNARARDFAKIGRLMLHKGVWNDTRLIPEDWIEKSTAVDTTGGSSWRYQYQWWLASHSGDFYAQGILGQYIYVNPEADMVIVRLGEKTGNVGWKNLFMSLAEAYGKKEYSEDTSQD